MKGEIINHGGCYEIVLTAETALECATLADAGLNHTKALRYSGAIVSPTTAGSIQFHAVFGKRKEQRSYIGGGQ